MTEPEGSLDRRARDLTHRLLRIRERPAIARRSERRANVALLAVGVAVAAAMIGGSIVVASRALHVAPVSTVPPVGTVAPNPTGAPATATAQPTCDTPDVSRENGPCARGSTTIQFVSPQQGWLVGPRSIVVTVDGGLHWNAQLDPHELLIGADFLDATHGWVVGVRSLFVTQDGMHWESLPQQGLSLWSVHFVSATDGWAIAGGRSDTHVVELNGVEAPETGGRLLQTRDGGRSWTPLPAPADAHTVCFADANNGWLGLPDAVYRSRDGGKSWQPSFRAKAATVGLGPETAFVECSEPPSAWVMFIGDGGAMSHAPYISFAAADGATWRPVLEEQYTESAIHPEVVAPGGPGSYPGPFSLVSPSTAVYFGFTPPATQGQTASMIVATGGGAALSKSLTVLGAADVIAAAFITADRGWIVDENTLNSSTVLVVRATSDGGKTWSPQFSAPG